MTYPVLNDHTHESFIQKYRPSMVEVGEVIEEKHIARMHDTLNIIVAIPAYNEEMAIGSIVARCRKYVDKVIVVDDGSKDHTSEISRFVGAEVVIHQKNGGYGAAIMTCFEAAKSHDADAMIIIDADGQHNPDDIPLLIDEMKKRNSDIVIGSRFVDGNAKNQKIPAYRKIGMKVLNMATNISSGMAITDSQSGFRIYSKKAIRSISLKNQDMAAGSEILIQAANRNLAISEVPIYIRYDLEDTSSKNPISHGFGVLYSLTGLMSIKRPKTLFGVPGIILFAAGMLLAIMAFDNFNTTGHIQMLYALGMLMFITIGVFCAFSGLILAAMQATINNSKTQI